MLKRIYVSGAVECDLDKLGRLLLPTDLRDHAASRATCSGPAWASTSSSGTRRASRRSSDAPLLDDDQACATWPDAWRSSGCERVRPRDRDAARDRRRPSRRARAASTSTPRWAGRPRAGDARGQRARRACCSASIAIPARWPRRASASRRSGSARSLLHGTFGSVRALLEQQGVTRVDGLVADLGVSSPQLDRDERGFSFARPGPLDMRMDPSSDEPLSELLETLDADELADVIYQYGDERRSRPDRALHQGRARARRAAHDRGSAPRGGPRDRARSAPGSIRRRARSRRCASRSTASSSSSRRCSPRCPTCSRTAARRRSSRSTRSRTAS